MPKNILLRGRIWHYRFRRGGRDYQGTLETADLDLAIARLAFKKKELSGRYWGVELFKTFDDAVARFRAEHFRALKPATQERYNVCIKALHSRFAGVFLRDVGSAALSEYEQHRKQQGVSSSTIRRDLACFSSIFTHVVAWEWHNANPVKAFIGGRSRNGLIESRPRQRSLAVDEEKLILAAAKPDEADVIAFAIDTGLRKEEQFSLRWEDVNLTMCEITVRADVAKNHRTRIVPLLPRAKAILERLPRHKVSPYVFVSNRGTRHAPGSRRFNNALAKALRDAGVARGAPMERTVWHDLRRTCGSRLMRVQNLDLFETSKWLGHSSVTITERAYVSHSVDVLHKALKRGREAEHKVFEAIAQT